LILGWAALVHSLLTNYELGLFKVLPFRVHLTLDVFSGALLAVSPWLFRVFESRVGFAPRARFVRNRGRDHDAQSGECGTDRNWRPRSTLNQIGLAAGELRHGFRGARRHGMKTDTISSERDIIDITLQSHGGVFRGVSDCVRHKLVPSVGRGISRAHLPQLVKFERSILRVFKSRGAPYLERTDYTDFDLLAIAQHHGLRTRLMDWSTNPLVSLYFSVCADDDRDGGLYVSPGAGPVVAEDEDPFNPGGDFWALPRHLSPRIIAQSGLFSIQQDPTQEFRGGKLTRYVVPAALKPRLRAFLRKWDIHAERLFPGLETLAARLNEGFDTFQRNTEPSREKRREIGRRGR
jgi:hypothetical protein